MQIIINIPDVIKEMADEGDKKLIHMMWMLILIDAIKNGVVLPKGHGRLIDADALNFNADYNDPLISKLDFDNAPTIIEADKEGAE